jgi:hypothetical protein
VGCENERAFKFLIHFVVGQFGIGEIKFMGPTLRKTGAKYEE